MYRRLPANRKDGILDVILGRRLSTAVDVKHLSLEDIRMAVHLCKTFGK